MDSTTLQKNLKKLVHTHLHSSMSGQPYKTSASDSNKKCPQQHHDHGHGHIDFADLWVHKPQWDSNENKDQINYADLWVHRPQLNNNENENNNLRKTKATDNWDRARELVFSMDRENDVGLDESARMFQKDISHCQSESFMEAPNLGGGVSSLVRRWRDFEAESKTANVANNSTDCSTRSNSGSFAEALQKGCDESSMDGRLETPPMSVNGESCGDLESERTAVSRPPSAQSRDSDFAESERIRVADIIKKLTSSGGEESQDREHNSGNNVVVGNGESLQRLKTSLDHSEQERGCFFPVLSSPRIIRGRQAYSDLLMQMERERHQELENLVERKTVSKFQQRGRIQALLRLRFLRRGADVRDCRSLNCTTSSESNRLMKHSAILHLREKFNNGGQHGVADSRSSSREVADNTSRAVNTREFENPSSSKAENQEPSDPISPCRELVENKSKDGNVYTSNQLGEENHHKNVSEQIHPILHAITNSSNSQEDVAIDTRPIEGSCRSDREVSTSLPQSTSQAQNSDSFHEQARWGKTWSEEASNSKSPEFVETARPPKDSKQTECTEYQGANNQQQTRTSNEWFNDITSAHSDWDEEAANQCIVESVCGWRGEFFNTPSEWDELQSNYQQQLEDNQDWKSDISRPRKEWEGLRQERYQEMLDPFLDNHDISQLLHRKTVSSFLTSGLREEIDRLMVTRLQQLPNASRSQIEEVAPLQVAEEEDKEEIVLQVDGRGGVEKREEDSCYDNDSENDISPIREQFNGPEELADQQTSSGTLHPWTNQVREVSDDTYHMLSTSQQSQLSNFYSQQNQPCSSSTRNPSFEMELIYEMKGHMEQLHREIFEIKRSINSCMNMQMNLQCSIKQEVAAAINQSGQTRGRVSDNNGPKRGNCCICYNVQVDSLLYRCGHMCTCFKCAHELLWGSGKCPICQAPIVDVVRAIVQTGQDFVP